MRGTQFIPAEVQETPFHRIPWQGIGLRQHRTIPALRLKRRSGSCGTASALPKCSIMSGCGTRIVLRGQKPLALCDRCPCSIICAFGLASAAPRSPYRHLELCGIALTLLLIFFICRIFLSSPIFPFPPQTKNIPVPCRFHPAKGTGMLFTDSNPISNHTLHQAGSPATAGWPSTQWITFLGHLVTQVPQEEHLA